MAPEESENGETLFVGVMPVQTFVLPAIPFDPAKDQRPRRRRANPQEQAEKAKPEPRDRSQ